MKRTFGIVWRRAAVLALCALGAAAAHGAERSRLYTPPDPEAPGGIRGVVGRPGNKPLVQALAIPPDEPRLVYEGRITEPDGRGFEFRGLPMRKYDLVLIYEDEFYEGVNLTRGEDTLTAKDKADIEKRVQECEPYFTVKVIHRLEGKTGDGEFARCICTFLRDLESMNTKDHRRTFKLVMLKDVGIGWQIERTRDLYPLNVQPNRDRIPHRYSPSIEGIRVADSIKDIGRIEL